MNTPLDVPSLAPADICSHQELTDRTWVNIEGLAALQEDVDSLLGLLSYCAVADVSSSTSRLGEVRSRIRRVTAELSQFYLDSLKGDPSCSNGDGV